MGYLELYESLLRVLFMTYEEFLKHNAELINNKDFDAIFKIATTPLRHFERLIEDLVDLGFTPETICPEITEVMD